MQGGRDAVGDSCRFCISAPLPHILLMTLNVRRSDVLRATLPAHSGNTGYLGFAPDGSDYHVVVPVDEQIARGIKAGNRPDDGTPFGGYRGWLYFQCRPHDSDSKGARETQVSDNAAVLVGWAAQRNIQVEIDD